MISTYSAIKVTLLAALAGAHLAHAYPAARRGQVMSLTIPPTAAGASIELTSSFASFSFEPAFWVEFFGKSSQPNNLTFELLSHIIERGGKPSIRPGGITMDSMIFDPAAGDPIRLTSPSGGVYRTTVGPAYYHSWSNFPEEVKFISTLNFGNESLDIARDMAVASVLYQRDRIFHFELGNEPTNYNSTRWKNSTEAYIQEWLEYTSAIDAAVDETADADTFPKSRWWASSATTDVTGLDVKPAALIPAGIDSTGEVAQYSIHSYEFSTCDPKRAAIATLPNILNHTDLVEYAEEEIYPSAKAALDAGSQWIIGEFNSISCSGNPGVTDVFAQALWVVDDSLIYATLNASAVYLHQGATLVFQSGQQINTAGDDGSPGYSTYDLFYPRDSSKRGKARALPSYVSQLFLAEAFAIDGTKIRALDTPKGLSEDHFSAYAFYVNNTLSKVALINMTPYFANSTSDFSVEIDLSQYYAGHRAGAWVKRMTAPYVDEGATTNVTWAGQSFEQGEPMGQMSIEHIGGSETLAVRGSEAVLVFLNHNDVYGLDQGGWGNWH